MSEMPGGAGHAAPAPVTDAGAAVMHRADTRVAEPFGVRVKRGLGAITVYAVLALALLSPMASNELMPSAADHVNHVALLIQARLAVDEGQAPIRVAPWESDGLRFPIYQFYSPLPYTVGAYVYKAVSPGNPFVAYKITLWIALLLAGYFTYLAGFWLTRDRLAALLGGVAYMSAPYLLINVHARGAFTEAIAQGLLPIVLYCSLRAFQASWRSPWISLTGLAWASLALTHNITYATAACFIGLLFVILAIGRRGIDAGLWRVGAGFALGLALSLYFLAPLMHAQYLLIHQHFSNLYGGAWITPLSSLLAPVSIPPEIAPGLHATTEHLNPNVGWPALIGVGLFVAGYSQLPRGGAGLTIRRAGAALIVVFALAFFMTWSPFDFWSWLPRSTRMVQFSYRLLTHVAWPAALLGACALAFGQREGLGPRQAAAGLILILLAHASFLPELKASDTSIAHLLEQPRMGYGAAAYQVASNRYFPDDIVELRMPLTIADAQGWFGGEVTTELPRAGLRGLTHLQIAFEAYTGLRPPAASAGGPTASSAPVRLAGPRWLLVTVDDQAPLRIPFTLHGGLAIHPIGDLIKASDAPYVRLHFALEPVDERVALPPNVEARSDLHVNRVTVSGIPAALPIFEVAETRPACRVEAAIVACRLAATQPAFAQLPALFYPGLVDVEVDGRPTPSFMFRTHPKAALSYALTGVRLEAGSHDVRVRFRGLAWANRVSLAALVLTIVGVALSLVFSRRAARADGLSRAAAPASIHAG